MIRRCAADDFASILTVINEAAEAYRGVIPADRWQEPYMSAAHLRREIEAGVRFFCSADERGILGVMGIQDVAEVTLVRHAYVRPQAQRTGVGGELMGHVRTATSRPMLVGTWADADWAVSFYRRQGFTPVSPEQTRRLLRRYWEIPERQVETSVVLADELAMSFVV